MTTEPVSTRCQALLNQEMGLLINGELTSGSAAETRQSFDPATGSVVGTYPNASPEDVDMAVAAAKAAQPGWAARPLCERQEIVQKVGQVLRRFSEELGYIDTLDTGNVYSSMSYPHGSPYGGWKKSGNGREGNIDELLSYTQIKSVNISFRKNVFEA